MEDYKKKYEQAMLRMNKWVEGSEIIDPKEVAEFVFPELRESEDEKIRKSIIDLVEKQMPKSENKKWIIAWLEKQGEQKSTDEVEPEPYFYCKYGGTIPLCSDCKRNYINSPFKTEEITTWHVPSKSTKRCIDYIVWPENQDKQNPAWSGEDERMLDRLIKHFDWKNSYSFDKKDCYEAQDWLKSLKERMKGE